MNVEESVSHWIDDLKNGDDVAARKLWERYFHELVRFADRRLPRHVRREFDEEDVALSAFASLCDGVRARRFPALEDRENLWSLLVVITARKVQHRLRDRRAARRGGGRVRGESVFGGAPGGEGDMGLNAVIGREPSPEFALEIEEESERLLDFLDDADLMAVARLKLQGWSNQEVAERLGCGLRTVERRLGLIRRLWASSTERDA